MSDLLSSLLVEVNGKPLWLWLSFFSTVVLLLAIDLGLITRRDEDFSIAVSLALTALYVAAACAFGVLIWHVEGGQEGTEYFAGFLIEKALSLENLAVLAMVMASVGIPKALHHRVLTWGILGVLVLRGLMIWGGQTLLNQVSWAVNALALYLILAGVSSLILRGRPLDIIKNPIVRMLSRFLSTTPNLHGPHFFVLQPDPRTGRLRRYTTPVAACSRHNRCGWS